MIKTIISGVAQCFFHVRLFPVFFSVIFGSYIPSTQASSEGMLLAAHFMIDSPGIDLSGPVQLSGTQNTAGISELKISAFGKIFVLSPDHLKLLTGRVINGVAMSYSAGSWDTRPIRIQCPRTLKLVVADVLVLHASIQILSIRLS